MNTCGKCHFYEAAGKGKDTAGKEFPVGTCFGAPPSVREGTTEYPTVREDRRECALWRAIALWQAVPPKASGSVNAVRKQDRAITREGKTR